jgi:hypothetical protein
MEEEQTTAHFLVPLIDDSQFKANTHSKHKAKLANPDLDKRLPIFLVLRAIAITPEENGDGVLSNICGERAHEIYSLSPSRLLGSSVPIETPPPQPSTNGE